MKLRSGYPRQENSARYICRILRLGSARSTDLLMSCDVGPAHACRHACGLPRPMMFASPSGVVTPPSHDAETAHPFWLLMGRVSPRPWLFSWFKIGVGPASRAENLVASAPSELVSRIKARPQDRLMQLDCYAPSFNNECWTRRRISAVWHVRGDGRTWVLFDEFDGHSFAIRDQRIEPLSGINPPRTLLARVEGRFSQLEPNPRALAQRSSRFGR